MRGKWYLFYLFYLLVAVLLVGCSTGSGEPTVSEKQTDAEPSLFVITLKPNPAKALQANQLTIRAQNGEEELLQDAVVTVTLSMPQMDHGTSEATVSSDSAGGFVAEVIPVMTGDWVAEIHIEKNGERQTLPFSFEAIR